METVKQKRSCPKCRQSVLLSAEWCPTCGSHIFFPERGKLAGLESRALAFFLDLLFPLLAFLAFPLLYHGLNLKGGWLDRATKGSAGILILLSVLLLYLFVAVSLLSKGTTPGKALLRLSVLDQKGESLPFWKMFLREFFLRWLSLFPLFAGYLYASRKESRQAFHDLILKSYVVKEKANYSIGKREEIGLSSPPLRKRFLASFMDFMLFFFLYYTIFIVSGYVEGSFDNKRVGEGWGVLSILVQFTLWTGWLLLMLKEGKSPGKVSLGLEIRKTTGEKASFFSLFLRALLKWCLLPLHLLYFLSAYLLKKNYAPLYDRWLKLSVFQTKTKGG